MAGAFRSHTIPQLEQRRAEVYREIASLVAFRQKIERRIEHLRNRGPMADPSYGTSATEVLALLASTDTVIKVLVDNGVPDHVRIDVAYALIAQRKDAADALRQQSNLT